MALLGAMGSVGVDLLSRRCVVAAVVVVLAGSAGCAQAPAPTVTPDEILREFKDAKTVGNDLFPTAGLGGDRDFSIEATSTAAQGLSLLEGAWACGRRPLVDRTGLVADPGFPVPAAVTTAARGANVSVRLPVVRHPDGGIELVPLYLAGTGSGATLIDASGDTFTGLDDFRSRNDILSSDDQMLIVQDPTRVLDPTADPVFPATGDLLNDEETRQSEAAIPPPSEPVVVVSGSTAPVLARHLGAGVGVLAFLVIVGGGIMLIRRWRRSR